MSIAETLAVAEASTMPTPPPVDPRVSQERMAARMAKLRLQGDEAPGRFALIGGLAGAGAMALASAAVASWALAVGAAVGGTAGWILGQRKRAAYRVREQQMASMLDRVERNSPD